MISGNGQPSKMCAAVFLPALLALLLALPGAAQQTGPLTPPPPSQSGPTPSAPPVRAPENAPGMVAPQTGAHLDTTPPPIPVADLIQKFAAREAEFKTERDNFTYTQTFIMDTLDLDGQIDGEYRMTSVILFSPGGKTLRTRHRRARPHVATHFHVPAGPGRPRARAAPSC